MSSEFKSGPWLIIGGVLLMLAITTGNYFRQEQVRQQEAKPPLLFTGAMLSDFQLTNQLGQAVNLESLRGQIWLGDVIFTRCPGPCLRMTRSLAAIAAELPPGSPVKLVSITTDPDNDTPAVLKRYAERFGAREDQWQFLTGPKKEIYRAAVEGMKLVVMEKKPSEREIENDLFIHSTVVALIDRQGRLRGQFPLLEPPSDEDAAVADSPAAKARLATEDAQRKQAVLDAVRLLLQEK